MYAKSVSILCDHLIEISSMNKDFRQSILDTNYTSKCFAKLITDIILFFPKTFFDFSCLFLKVVQGLVLVVERTGIWTGNNTELVITVRILSLMQWEKQTNDPFFILELTLR